jgi:hypothetical protein
MLPRGHNIRLQLRQLSPAFLSCRASHKCSNKVKHGSHRLQQTETPLPIYLINHNYASSQLALTMANPLPTEPPRGKTRLSLLHLPSLRNRHIVHSDDDQGNHATQDGLAHSSRPSCHDSFVRLMDYVVPAPGYEFSILSDTNSTMSNITGAGVCRNRASGRRWS